MDAHIKFTMDPPDSEEASLSWTPSALPTLITQSAAQYTGNQHMQTDI